MHSSHRNAVMKLNGIYATRSEHGALEKMGTPVKVVKTLDAAIEVESGNDVWVCVHGTMRYVDTIKVEPRDGMSPILNISFKSGGSMETINRPNFYIRAARAND